MSTDQTLNLRRNYQLSKIFIHFDYFLTQYKYTQMAYEHLNSSVYCKKRNSQEYVK